MSLQLFNSPLFVDLLKSSDVKTLIEAIERPFFMGLKHYKDEYDIAGTVVYEPALTEARILERLKDEAFCRFCFMRSNGHDYECRLSPWKGWK